LLPKQHLFEIAIFKNINVFPVIFKQIMYSCLFVTFLLAQNIWMVYQGFHKNIKQHNCSQHDDDNKKCFFGHECKSAN